MSVELGRARILHEVSLTVSEREFVCVIGTSGGGKATLQRTIAGLLPEVDLHSDLPDLARLGAEPLYGTANPLAFMELQDVQELSNFFERRVSAYQVGVSGTVTFDEDF